MEKLPMIEEIEKFIALIGEIDLDVREKVFLHIPAQFNPLQKLYKEEIYPKMERVKIFLVSLETALIELETPQADPEKIEETPGGLGKAASKPAGKNDPAS